MEKSSILKKHYVKITSPIFDNGLCSLANETQFADIFLGGKPFYQHASRLYI